jgi:hypothetical protein
LTDPPARALKRAWTGSAPRAAKHDRIPSRAGLQQMLADAGLTVRTVRYVGTLLLPAPVDRLIPVTAQRLGIAFEGRRRGRTLLATQLVVGARKDA